MKADYDKETDTLFVSFVASWKCFYCGYAASRNLRTKNWHAVEGGNMVRLKVLNASQRVENPRSVDTMTPQ